MSNILPVVLLIKERDTSLPWYTNHSWGINQVVLWYSECGTPSLPPICAKAILIIVEERLTRLTNINSFVGYDNRLFMESWNFWKFSHRFYWRCNFRVAVFFDVSFFDSYFISYSQPLVCNCDNLRVLGRFQYLNQGYSWRFNNLLISPSFDLVLSYIIYSYLE